MLEGSPGSGLARLEASVKKGLVSLLVIFFLSALPPLTSLGVPPAQERERGDRGQGSSSWARALPAWMARQCVKVAPLGDLVDMCFGGL